MGLTGDSTSDRMRERNRPAGAEGFGTRMSNNSEDLSDLYENWESEQMEALASLAEDGVSNEDFDLDSITDEDDSYFYEEDSIDFLAEEDDRGDEDEDFIDLSDLFDDMEG